MTRNKFIIAATGIALFAALAWYTWGARQTPPGQPQLVSLNAQNLTTLFQQFDAASDKTRILVLLSPT